MIFTLWTLDRRICKYLNLERLFVHRSIEKKHGRRNGFFLRSKNKYHILYISNTVCAFGTKIILNNYSINSLRYDNVHQKPLSAC